MKYPSSHEPQHAWLIGASRGMGLETARLLIAAGWRVTISARSAATLETTCASVGATALPLDITDREGVAKASAALFREDPPQLVLINAGDYRPMPLAEFDVALFEQLNRVNYLGVVYVLDAVLKPMRDNGGGQILVNVSAAAYRGLPMAAPYSAPKAAALNLAEALQPEARQWGIDLRVINPGFVRSALTEQNSFAMPALMEAENAARRIFSGITQKRFEISFPRRFIWPLKLLRCLPYRLYFALIKRLVAPHG